MVISGLQPYLNRHRLQHLHLRQDHKDTTAGQVPLLKEIHRLGRTSLRSDMLGLHMLAMATGLGHHLLSILLTLWVVHREQVQDLHLVNNKVLSV